MHNISQATRIKIYPETTQEATGKLVHQFVTNICSQTRQLVGDTVFMTVFVHCIVYAL